MFCLFQRHGCVAFCVLPETRRNALSDRLATARRNVIPEYPKNASSSFRTEHRTPHIRDAGKVTNNLCSRGILSLGLEVYPTLYLGGILEVFWRWETSPAPRKVFPLNEAETRISIFLRMGETSLAGRTRPSARATNSQWFRLLLLRNPFVVSSLRFLRFPCLRRRFESWKRCGFTSSFWSLRNFCDATNANKIECFPAKD